MLTYKIIHIYIINQVIYDSNCDMNGGLVLLLARRKMTRSYQTEWRDSVARNFCVTNTHTFQGRKHR